MADVNESIGLGATVHINDGASSAYVLIDMLVDYEPPDEVLGTVESKRLVMPSNVLIEVPTLLKPGNSKIRQQMSQAGFARMESLKRAKGKKNFKFTVPDDTSTTVVIVGGYITSNKRMKVEVDKLQEFETSVTHTGPQS